MKSVFVIAAAGLAGVANADIAAVNGVNLGNAIASDMVTFSADIDNLDGTRTALVETASLDAAGATTVWVDAGLAGNGFVSWRMDVGTTAGGPDAINPALGAGQSINVLGSGFAAFDTAGGLLGVFALSLDDSTASSLSGLAVIGIGGGDIAGFDLGSIQLFWDYEIVPAPASAALLGLGGLVAVRRRR